MATRPLQQHPPQTSGPAASVVALAAGLFQARVGLSRRLEQMPEAIADECLELAETFYRRAAARQTQEQ